VQTVRPLALARQVPVEEREELAEGAPVRAALDLLRSTGGAVVASGHGDQIPAVVSSLADRGVELTGPLECKKGSAWLLERDGGLFTTARSIPPPS